MKICTSSSPLLNFVEVVLVMCGLMFCYDLSAAPLFFDDFESGLGNWTVSGTWGLTAAKSTSPSHSATDSPGTFYADNTDSALTMAGSVNLNGVTRPALSFQHTYALENNYDYGYVEVSTNGGATWVAPALAAYTGNQGTWACEQLDLSSFTNSTTVSVRFHLATDSSVVMDGWYVDDVRIANAPDPVTLSATQTNRTAIRLAWTPSASSSFASYRLFRSLSPGVDWHTAYLVSEISNIAATNATDIAVSPKSKYYYRLAVVNSDGILTLGNEIQVATPAGMDYPFLDNGEGGSATWIADAPWALSTEDAASPTHAWSDSPGTAYSNNIASQSITLVAPLFLAGNSVTPELSYVHKYDFTAGDSANVEVSTNGGISWLNMASYTGTATNTWNRGRSSLVAYTNSPVLVRFRITTSTGIRADGWHVDDISVAETPTAISAPVLDNITSHSIRVNWVANTNQFFSYYAVMRSTTVGMGINGTLAGVLTNQSATSFTDTNLALNTVYYYRVYAVSPYGAFSSDSPVESSAQTLNNPVPFNDDFESGLNNWNLTGTWNLTTNSTHSGLFSLTDSPQGTYANSSDSYALTAVNLTGTAWPVLRFWDRFRLASGDFAYVEVSPDGGNWYRLYGVTGIRTNWADQSIDLSPWKNQSNLRIRLHLITDGSTTDDGWYVDDLSVTDNGAAVTALPFYEGFENGLTNWVHSSWAVDTNAPDAGSAAVHDTPTGLMPPSTYLPLELNGALNLTNHPNAQLTFWLRGHLNPYSAFGAQVSTDGGLNWVDLSAVSVGYGYNNDSTWVRKQVALSAYNNQTIRLRLVTYEWGGAAPDSDIWVDNIGIGDPPSGPPSLNAPAQLSSVSVLRPTLVVNNAIDYQSNPLSYRFEVYSDAALSNIVSQVPIVASGATTTPWQVDVDLPNNSQFWWRCRASDGTNTGPWMATASFYVNYVNNPPYPVVIAAPVNQSILTDTNGVLTWYPTVDPDLGDYISLYRVQVSSSAAFSASLIDSSIALTNLFAGPYETFSVPLSAFTGSSNLVSGFTYYWRVSARDNHGAWSAWPPDSYAFKFGAVILEHARFTRLWKIAEGRIGLEWAPNPNNIYVEFSTNLQSGSWTNVAGPLTGTNWTDTTIATGKPSGFYRLRSE